MRMVEWTGGTESGRIAVQVVGDSHTEDGKVTIHNRRVELNVIGVDVVHLNPFELQGTEAAELAKILATASARLAD